MFQKIANLERKIQEKFATKKARKEVTKQAIEKINSMDLEALENLLNKKIVESDEVTETAIEENPFFQKMQKKMDTTKKIKKKTKMITEYTYFINSEIKTKSGETMTSKKAHGIISMMLSKHGVKVSGFGKSKTGLREEYLKFGGNTDEQNQKINEVFETVESFKKYLHRSPRKTKEVLVQ